MFADNDIEENLSPEQHRVFKSTFGTRKNGKLQTDAIEKKWEPLNGEDITTRILMLGCAAGKKELGLVTDVLGEVRVPQLEGHMLYGFRNAVQDQLFPGEIKTIPTGEINVPPRGKVTIETKAREQSYLQPGMAATLFQLYKRQYYMEQWCRAVSHALASSGMDIQFPLGEVPDPATLEEQVRSMCP